ncbi:hypothetical protein AB0F15_27790 [Amycolatopsis sp. NPDC026612]|uniref:hypothetical protein n=1 Tax=Amycolatopsis sp. NPDC026612 TaxID=3155466 RepID=UPI0033DCCE86
MNKKLVGSAVVGAAILAIVAAQFLGGTDAAPAAAPPPSTATPTATTLPYQETKEIYDFPAEPGSETGGFDVEIPVPTGWAVEHDKDHATYHQGDLVLETDRAPLRQEDPLSGLAALEKSVRLPGYQLSAMTNHPPVADYDAAKWEYRYQGQGGVTRQVREIGLGVGEVLITIRYDAPVPAFTDHVKVLDDALKVTGAG